MLRFMAAATEANVRRFAGHLLIGILLTAAGRVAAEAPGDWNLNDVSYLFPFPGEDQDDLGNWLSPVHSGKKGELLPRELFKILPTLMVSGPGNELLYSRGFRVVAMRFDPCPVEYTEDNCQSEIRLVWQPLLWDRKSRRWRAQDVAIHSFYRLNAQEFLAVRAALLVVKRMNQSWGINTARVPLGVHPAFLHATRGPGFNQELQNLLLSFCGQENLFKITFMSEFVPSQWWRFGGLEREGFSADRSCCWRPFTVPRLAETVQDVFNIAVEEGPLEESGQEVDTKITLLPVDYPQADLLSPLLDQQLRFNDERDLPIFADKLDAVERFRNPRWTHSSNLDCVACHYADAAQFYAHRQFPKLATRESAFSYRNPNRELYDLSRSAQTQHATRMLRAFGYFADQPAVSQRVIHDSAESAEFLNQQQ